MPDQGHTGRNRIVVVGGGMAGLSAAWALSNGDWRTRHRSITVYQRGWRLGGKGASSRGPHDRIEEHGLHVLLGYYHQTFALMDRCYRELDRDRTAPLCPIRTWDQAVERSATVSLTDRTETGWEPWSMRFGTDDEMPGRDSDHDWDRPLSVVELVNRSFRLLIDFHRTVRSHDDRTARTTTGAGLVLSASPVHPADRGRGADSGPDRTGADGDLLVMLRAMGLTTLAAGYELFDQLARTGEAVTDRSSTAGGLVGTIDRARTDLLDRIAARADRDGDLGRLRSLVDLVLANLRGIAADNLLDGRRGLAAVDHLDYRQWLAGHGASPSTLDSAVVRGMYDLVFAYRDGDPERPAFSAGLGLTLATRMLLDYRGSVFWRMQAGMGEVVFAPLYQALRDRGVEFRFFHQLESVEPGPDQVSIDALRFHRQTGGGCRDYDPLIDVDGLPAWPDRPLYDRLDPADRDRLDDSEAVWHQPRGPEVTLRVGDDFDQVVLAVGLGIVPRVCSRLVADDPRWAAMVAKVGTVATQSFQLWLDRTDRELGWTGPDDTTLSGFRFPFDTWASMGHLIDREGWNGAVDSIAYFCSALPDRRSSSPASPTAEDAAAATAEVVSESRHFLDHDVGALWPQAVDVDRGFDWGALVGDGEPDVTRLDQQYHRANVDPSDRYVQSLPGTDRYRIAPDRSGYSNLFPAGDWTDCGLNAGCIEAATRSGLLAARAAEAAQPTMATAERTASTGTADE